MKDFKIDFDTMRSNCIQIHQEVHEMILVAKHIGETLKFPYDIIEANDLMSNDFTKNWNGMGIFAKDLYDNESLWNQLPSKLTIQLNTCKKEWIKEEAKSELLDCYYQLGAKNLYK